MSFPPRPPLGMPPMTPGLGYPYPMGVVPMPMPGMIPTATVMRPVVTTQSAVIQKPPKKLIPQEIPKNEEVEKPPVTTVFVGNISERAPDTMIRQMLQRCGNVLSWKRVQGASGKLQAFGFCEYEYPEATLRCMRLLNEWEIADKKLVVKVDAKTKTLLDEYKNKRSDKKSTEKKENGEEEKKDGTDEDGKKEEGEKLDEFTMREDRVAQAGLDAIMKEYAMELSKPIEIEKESKSQMVKKESNIPKDTGIEDIDMEEDKRFLINREIQSFRDLHKGEDDPEKEAEKEKERERERRINEEKRRRDKERQRERERELEREKERERERFERERYETRSRTRSPDSRRRRRSASRERSRDREERRRTRDREREVEDEEEAHERRRLEKKLREKEAAYQERLKNWESRERKKSREYEKDREREEERKEEEAKEAKRLKAFLEDYDDERDDPKFYKGSGLIRRMKERDKEREADARDRQREKEELEEIRRQLLEEGHPDPEAELAKIEREREEHLIPRLNLADLAIPHGSSSHTPAAEDQDMNGARDSQDDDDDDDEESSRDSRLPPKMAATLRPVEASSVSENEDSNLPDDGASGISYGPTKEENRRQFGSLKFGSNSPTEGPSTSKRKKLTVGDVFNQDDDDSSDAAKKRKLVPLDYDDDKSDKKATTAEEKRAKIKHLIESIPTAKEELFAYPLDWSIVDNSLMDKRIKPWVNKKIIEYIGEEEPTLTDFICQKVVAKSVPQNILNDVAMVLDEEAEVFVVKMWRLLVYETEAKKLGLVK